MSAGAMPLMQRPVTPKSAKARGTVVAAVAARTARAPAMPHSVTTEVSRIPRVKRLVTRRPNAMPVQNSDRLTPCHAGPPPKSSFTYVLSQELKTDSAARYMMRARERAQNHPRRAKGSAEGPSCARAAGAACGRAKRQWESEHGAGPKDGAPA